MLDSEGTGPLIPGPSAPWLDLGMKINTDQIWSRIQARSSVPEVLFPEHTLDKRITKR